ncbi:hypothetical protein NH340_JMT01138 [Sarcoptes scabiei]|nr:hypothetical protein NH340_JMT01138 [Sarcoptes scabiei]
MMLFGKIGRVLILIAVLEAAVLADFDSSRDEDKWWDTELSRNERQIDKESQIVQLDSLIDQDEDQTLAEYIDDKARPEFVRIPFEKKPVLIENNEPTVFGARIPVVKQEERSQNNIGQITLDRNVDTSLRPKAGILSQQPSIVASDQSIVPLNLGIKGASSKTAKTLSSNAPKFNPRLY